MKLPECVWYVSGFRQPWEADVIGNLAEAVRSRGTPLFVYVKGGTANLHVEGVMSWNSLTFFERLKAVLGGGKLWHLWGEAPFWWWLVRLRARTVHTSLSTKSRWRGHPTRLFKAQAADGENRILPTFEPKASWTDLSPAGDDPDDSALVMAWNGDAGTRKNILEAWESLPKDGGGRSNSKILVIDAAPASVLQAVYMTMRGVPVIAPDAPLIREALGQGGYIAAPQADDRTEWEKTLQSAASDAGRSVSAAARRFLKENYSAAAAAESLKSLYEAVGRGRL